jgi:hypothetical protein
LAALRFKLNIPSTSLAAATAKTVGQLRAPTNQRVRVYGFGLHFDAAAAGQPVTIRLLRQTTNGTMTTATLQKTDEGISTTIQSTAGTNATVEPTAGPVLGTFTCYPQGGLPVQFNFDDEVIIGSGNRLGLEVTAPATVNVMGWMSGEE